MSKTVKKKSNSLRVLSESLRDLFNLPETEKVIQNYQCGIKGIIGSRGKIYITQNYILYKKSIPLRTKKIPFRKVNDITTGRLLIAPYLSIELKGGETFVLTSFFGQHCAEAYALTCYLWRNPPSYVSVSKLVEERRIQDEEERILNEQNKVNLLGEKSFRGGPKISGSFQGHSQIQRDEIVAVDIEASQRALRLAQRSNGLAMEAIETLARQGEQLDRIEGKVNNIHVKLDLSKEYIRSIESLPGYIGNSIKKKKKKMEQIENSFTDRTISIVEQERTMDIEILCKMKDDSLKPAVLVLKNSGFECIDPETDSLIKKKFSFDYTAISELVIRARHEHLDIRFSDGTERFRLMSSYLQIIVNELYIRCEGEVEVIFELGAKEFEYDDPKISIIPPTSRKTKGSFSRFGSQEPTSSLLQNADQQTIDDLNTTDRHLETISRLVNNTNNIAISMGTELDRQSEQLDRLNIKVEDSNNRLQKTNQRILKATNNT